jgi:1,2-phenylacetyl-CoA epoxidase PaaB subunit
MSRTTSEAQPAQASTLQVVAETKMWEVFARRKYEEPLHHVGTLAADDPELAKVYARSIYDEFSWVEMVIAPREAFVPVIKP